MRTGAPTTGEQSGESEFAVVISIDLLDGMKPLRFRIDYLHCGNLYRQQKEGKSVALFPSCP
jgi:hypothetical protein